MKWLIAALLLLATPAFAADVTVLWEAPDDERVTGYNIYYGSGNPPSENMVEVPGRETTSQEITGLTEGETIYFGATSRDADGNESLMSDIIEWRVETGSVIIQVPRKPKELRLIFE